jgi:hypothetical protein
MVPRAEDGEVRYLLGEPEGLHSVIEVGRDEVAWIETLRPTQLVRLTASGIDRVRPGRAPGLQAGDILFGYELSTGFAYCPVRPTNSDLQRVQCYRDFNDDGAFEGTYVTLPRGFRSMMLPGGVRSLAAMPPVTYELADASAAPTGSASTVFAGWRDGRARFRMRVDEEWLDDPFVCEPDGAGVCSVLGLNLRVTELPDSKARIELVAAQSDRALRVCFDSAAPGTPCRGR